MVQGPVRLGQTDGGARNNLRPRRHATDVSPNASDGTKVICSRPAGLSMRLLSSEELFPRPTENTVFLAFLQRRNRIPIHHQGLARLEKPNAFTPRFSGKRKNRGDGNYVYMLTYFWARCLRLRIHMQETPPSRRMHEDGKEAVLYRIIRTWGAISSLPNNPRLPAFPDGALLALMRHYGLVACHKP